MGWLSGWAYRRAVTITNNTSTDLTDYQVRIELDSSNFDFSKANADGSDIRFAADDGETLLAYWIEKWDSSNEQAVIWVKVPSIPAGGSTTIYLYYGNPQAQSESDPEQVFEFFDDFEGDSLDTNKWVKTIESSASVTLSDSILDISTPTGNQNRVCLATQRSFAQPVVIEAKVMLKKPYVVYLLLSSSQTSKQAPYVCLQLSYRSNYPTCIGSNDGNSEVTSNLATITGNEWHLVGIKTDGNTHTGYWDDNTASVAQANSFSGYAMIYHVSAYDDSMETLVDWFRIRKYAEQEPSVSVGGEETPPIPVKIWDGSAWVDVKAVKVWDGSAWVDAKAIYVWDGSSWVKL